MTWSNWTGDHSCEQPYSATSSATSESAVDQVAELISTANKVGIAGSGHSFTDIVSTEGLLITPDWHNQIVSTDTTAKQLTVGFGVTVRNLAQIAWKNGLSLTNQGDIDKQTITGAMATGTHGTGASVTTCLSDMLAHCQLITAQGELLSIDRNHDYWPAIAASLGSLGLIYEATLDLVPAFNLTRCEWQLDAEDFLENGHNYAEQYRHFEGFWFPGADLINVTYCESDIEQVNAHLWNEESAAQRSELEDAALTQMTDRLISNPQQMIKLHKQFAAASSGTSYLTGQAWQIFASDRRTKFRELEYSVPREVGLKATRAVAECIRAKQLPTSFPIEIRWTTADDTWLSSSSNRASMTISVHQDVRMPHGELFREVETLLRDYGGRPHLGKLHSLTYRELAQIYPKLDDFIDVMSVLDPNRKFLNNFKRDLFSY